MGLTVSQSQKIMNIVEERWAVLESARFKTAQAVYDSILSKWNADPRVLHFATAYVAATGEDWWTRPAGGGYMYAVNFGNQWIENAARYWPDYLSGVKDGSLWEALNDAGYHTSAKPERMAFRSTSQSGMMDTALRTTGKNWGKLSDTFAALAINTALATDTDELLVAVQNFMDSLK